MGEDKHGQAGSPGSEGAQGEDSQYRPDGGRPDPETQKDRLMRDHQPVRKGDVEMTTPLYHRGCVHVNKEVQMVRGVSRPR